MGENETSDNRRMCRNKKDEKNVTLLFNSWFIFGETVLGDLSPGVFPRQHVQDARATMARLKLPKRAQQDTIFKRITKRTGERTW